MMYLFVCPKCIEINCKLRQCYLDKGFRVNICSGDIVMCKMNSATCTNPGTSACNTCLSVSCQCCEDNDEEDLFELGDYELSNSFPFEPACNTCPGIACHCCENNDEDLFELRCTFPSGAKRPSVDTVLDTVEAEELEYHLNTEHVQLIDTFAIQAKEDYAALYKSRRVSMLNKVSDKVSDGFLVVCALFALSFNRVIDFVLDGFQKAFRSDRL